MFTPAWLTDGLQKRFEELTLLANEDPKIKQTNEKIRQALEQMEVQICEDGMAAVLRWEEQWYYAQTVEKEWYYGKGVRDGVQLMLSLMKDASLPS